MLPEAFGEESFAFYGTVLQGTPKRRDRWKRAVDATGGALGEAVGQLYVRKYFPPADKARIEAMVKNLIAAFGRRIDALDWMAPATKAKAKAKLATLKVRVGYPDRLARLLERSRSCAATRYGNAQRAELFEYRRNLAKLGQPVDRGEWVMTPQTVNAVNLPVMNAMNFPAAILQPPYFDPARPLAMDYGAIGAVIGHEISHSFDDQGALFDASGRLENWWTEADLAHFQAAAERLVEQYDAYQAAARPARQRQADAQREHRRRRGAGRGLRRLPHVARRQAGARRSQGLSGDQQFFISFAQSWRAKIARRPAAPADPGRRPRARRVPRRRGPQPRRLVRRFRGQAGPEAVPGAGRSRPGLVRAAEPGYASTLRVVLFQRTGLPAL